MGDEKLLAIAKGIILEITSPKRIILFGSWARGEVQENSDIDLLVVVPDGTSTKEIATAIRCALISPFASYDILVFAEGEFELKRKEGWRFFEEIARDGKIVYAA
jgi:predicted nucleotidyltransferase